MSTVDAQRCGKRVLGSSHVARSASVILFERVLIRRAAVAVEVQEGRGTTSYMPIWESPGTCITLGSCLNRDGRISRAGPINWHSSRALGWPVDSPMCLGVEHRRGVGDGLVPRSLGRGVLTPTLSKT